jgi:hypothetical protein
MPEWLMLAIALLALVLLLILMWLSDPGPEPPKGHYRDAHWYRRQERKLRRSRDA